MILWCMEAMHALRSSEKQCAVPLLFTPSDHSASFQTSHTLLRQALAPYSRATRYKLRADSLTAARSTCSNIQRTRRSKSRSLDHSRWLLPAPLGTQQIPCSSTLFQACADAHSRAAGEFRSQINAAQRLLSKHCEQPLSPAPPQKLWPS